MDIQSFILDHWLSKFTAEKPVLTIYDELGIYSEIISLAEKKGIKVFNTTKGLLHSRLSASRFWCKELDLNKNSRMIIYRKKKMPSNNNEWVEEPFASFSKVGVIFPLGPQDEYKNLCLQFLPNKKDEINNLFKTETPSFDLINKLLDGSFYPELEQFTDGNDVSGITIGLLQQKNSKNMNWQNDWASFAQIHFPNLDYTGISLNEIQIKLWTYMLFSEFVFDLPQKLPDSLKTVAKAPDEIKENIYKVCKEIRNRVDFRETYVIYANKIAEQLNLAELFSKSKHLGDRITFSFENSVEFDRFITHLKDRDYLKAKELYEKNIKDLWYQEDSNVKSFWNLANYALILLECLSSPPTNVSFSGNVVDKQTNSNFKQLVEWYANTGYKADYAFRRYHTVLKNITANFKQIKELTEYINNSYREFTGIAVELYQNKIKELIKINDLRNQSCIEKVYPALKEGKRVAFFMVDALRYEMGKALAESLEHSFSERVSISPKISYLPSITSFGMANHLGNINIQLKSDILEPFIDSKIISYPEQRINYLKEKTSVEVQDFELDKFDSTAIESNTRLLVIRSTTIDVEGENNKLNGLATMESELNSLRKAIAECKNLKFDLAVIVADHGFMLQPSFKAGDQINKPFGNNIILEKSRLLAGNINESEDTITFLPSELGSTIPSNKLSYAKAFTTFKKGEVYFHEGLSLQENVVPLICIELQDNKKKQTYRISLNYKKDTIRTYRPLIDIMAEFENLFFEDVSIKLKITDEKGNIIGKAETSSFLDELSQLIVIPSNCAKIRQPISIDEEYHGNIINITALDSETNMTLCNLKLNFEGND